MCVCACVCGCVGGWGVVKQQLLTLLRMISDLSHLSAFSHGQGRPGLRQNLTVYQGS